MVEPKWNNVPKDINDYEGFVYIIHNLKNKKYYIGKKSFWNRKKLKGLKKMTSVELKRIKRYEENNLKKKLKEYKKHVRERLKNHVPRNRRVKVESDWEIYNGSCEELIKDIELQEGNMIEKDILMLCKTKSEMSYQELLMQIEYDVLNDKNAYNGIMHVRLTRTK